MLRRVLWVVLAVLVAVEPAPSPDGGGGGGGAARVGVLRVGVARLGSLDPAQARSMDQLLVADQLFDSLTALDPSTLAPVPSLAARWESSPDQRRWTFHLRPDATFSDGRPVAAGDVKASLERVARRGSRSPGAELLQVVDGFAELRGGAPGLAGVTTPGRRVVTVVLDEPLAELPTMAASPVLGVVPPEAAAAAGDEAAAAAFAESPVGSGPFRLEGRRRGGAVLSLVPSPGTRTGVGRVEVVQYAAVGDAYRAFTAGQLDWARVPPEEVTSAARRYGDGAFRPYLAELFYAFNLASPKLADVRFREAIVRGIDRRAVVAAVYQGTVAPADGVVLEGVPGHRPGACPRCAHDPARSRALLAEVFPGGEVPEVGLDYDADPAQEAIARAIRASLAEVGVPVALRPRPPEEYDEVALSGGRELFRLGWVAAYPSPDAFLWPLFRSGSANNLTGFASADVDERLAAARAEPDPARRASLYHEAERAILDQVPVVPIAQFQVHAVVSERVRNLVATSLGTFDASTVSLAGRR